MGMPAGWLHPDGLKEITAHASNDSGLCLSKTVYLLAGTSGNAVVEMQSGDTGTIRLEAGIPVYGNFKRVSSSTAGAIVAFSWKGSKS